MLMVKYKGIIEERTEDCPDGEYGALVVSTNCHRNCPGCFNQHLKDSKEFEDSAEAIVDRILVNPLHQWCILGGLEWSEDPAGLEAITLESLRRGLKVIIYTGCNPDEFMQRLGKEVIQRLQGCYVKFGSYMQNRVESDISSFGIKMASSNQFVSML